MTKAPELNKGTISRIKPTILFVFLTVSLLIFRSEISEAIIKGMKFAVLGIIPNLFPFFVISDYIVKNPTNTSFNPFTKIYEILFGLPKNSLITFVLGNVCGFPLGIKCVEELYKSGAITENEAQRLAPLANNPSIAFTISVVGAGMLKNIKFGVFLYLSTILSTFTLGILTRKIEKETKVSNPISKQKYSLVESIKDAGISSLTICSFIIFFSAVLGLIKAITDSDFLLMISSILLEIGNASILISTNTLISSRLTFSLLGFSLGFSGFCVHLQGFSFFPKELSKRKYLLDKLIIGILNFIYTYAISLFVL